MKSIRFSTKTANVQDTCVNEMAEVFHDVDTIDASGIDESCADLLTYLAPIWDQPKSHWKVHLDTVLDELETSQLIVLLSFANFVGHDLIIDRAATTIAGRMDMMSFGDMAEIFGTESCIPESMVYKYVHPDAPEFL